MSALYTPFVARLPLCSLTLALPAPWHWRPLDRVPLDKHALAVAIPRELGQGGERQGHGMAPPAAAMPRGPGLLGALPVAGPFRGCPLLCSHGPRVSGTPTHRARGSVLEAADPPSSSSPLQ